MERGKYWDLQENAVLAGAPISESEDHVFGADQKDKMFFKTMKCHFTEKGPSTAYVGDGKYGLFLIYCSLKYVAELSTYVQKFGIALRRLRACNPTGLQEDDIILIAVAVHMGKCTTMYYGMKDYCKKNGFHTRYERSGARTGSVQ